MFSWINHSLHDSMALSELFLPTNPWFRDSGGQVHTLNWLFLHEIKKNPDLIRNIHSRLDYIQKLRSANAKTKFKNKGTWWFQSWVFILVLTPAEHKPCALSRKIIKNPENMEKLPVLPWDYSFKLCLSFFFKIIFCAFNSSCHLTRSIFKGWGITNMNLRLCWRMRREK